MDPFNYSSHKFLFLFLNFFNWNYKVTIPLEMSTQKKWEDICSKFGGDICQNLGGQLPQKWEDFC